MLDELIRNVQGSTTQGATTQQNNQSSFSLDQLLTGAGGLATGAAAGGLAAMLLGGAKPKKLAKNALKVGGVALVGGLAYKAWNNWQANKTASAPVATASRAQTPPADAPFFPSSEPAQHSLARSLARAMISAAKADGHITQGERERILDELHKLNIQEADHAFIRDLLDNPSDMEALVRDAHTPEIAAELYAASLLTIDPTGEAERAYLGLLAARLKLDRDLVEHIHESVADGSTSFAV